MTSRYDDMTTMDDALQLGLKYHQAGDLVQAERIYRQILQAEPGHADALHSLGVLAGQRGRHDLAIEYLSQALRASPFHAGYQCNLAGAYRQQGRRAEAEAACRESLRIDPTFSAAHAELGMVLA